jgi:hypothetical protein
MLGVCRVPSLFALAYVSANARHRNMSVTVTASRVVILLATLLERKKSFHAVVPTLIISTNCLRSAGHYVALIPVDSH